MEKNQILSRLTQTAAVATLWAATAMPALAQATTPGWAWARAFGGSTVASNDASAAKGVGTDAAGNVYVLGHFVGTTDFGGGVVETSAGETDIFLAKYNPAGSLLWARVLAGTGMDKAGQLAVSAAGRCVISGLYGGLSGDNLTLPGGQVLPGPQQAGAPVSLNTYGDFPFVASFNAQGVKEWAMRFSDSYLVTSEYVCLSVTGTAYVGGSSRSAITNAGVSAPVIGASDAYLASINPQGVTQWIRRAGLARAWSGGGKPVLDDVGNLYWMVGTDTPGTFVSNGQSYPLPGPDGGSILLKISPQNRTIWGRTNAGLASTTPSRYVYTNIRGYDAASNSLLFSANTPLSATSVQFGGGGVAPVAVPANAAATIVGRIDTSGVVTSAALWAFARSAPANTWAYPPNITALFGGQGGGLTVVGQINDDFTLVETGRAYVGQRGLLIATRLDPLATLNNWTRFATINANFANYYSDVTAAALDGQGNVYVTGTFPTPAQFGTLAPLLPSRGGFRPDGFVAKLDMATVTATRAGAQGLAWEVYPNPATGQVQLAGLPPLAQVRLFDVQGRLVRTVQTPVLSKAECALNLTGLAAGLYTLQVGGTAQVFRTQRLTVE